MTDSEVSGQGSRENLTLGLGLGALAFAGQGLALPDFFFAFGNPNRHFFPLRYG